MKDARRHRLTILCSDLQGSSALARGLEIEQFAELLAAVRGRWQAAAQRHGGTVLRIQGDGALIVFGLPHAAEDDGRRAAACALEIHAAVDGLGAEAGVPLRLRSGLHAGIVLLTEGDLERGRMDLSGDAVHVAAHLQRDAPPGGILASLDALGPDAHCFELGPDPRPGPAGPAEVVQVLGHVRVARRFDALVRRGLTPFVGRERLFGQLAELFAGPAAPRCIVVQGGPGLGKTRLVEEFLARRLPSHWQLLLGHCETQGGARLLQPFVQMLGGREASDDVAHVHDELRLRLQAGPTLLVIDDWQWADDASRRLLVRLLQAPDGPRVLLAARPREDGLAWMADSPHLPVPPLDPAESAQAVRLRLPDADPFLARRIHDHAGGVPLFVEELCLSAASQSLWQTLDGRPASTGWLGGLVASRLERLPPAAASLVRAAAVIGTACPVTLLAEVCGGPPDAAVLQLLADADFLHPDAAGRLLSFKHGVTREAVVEATGLYERTDLHRRIEARLLAGSPGAAELPDPDEALAHHARGAGHWERATEAAERAGDRAVAAFALGSARRLYRSALEAIDRRPGRTAADDARWVGLAAKLAYTCVFDPLSLPDGLAVFERARLLAERSGEPLRVARARYWLGYLKYAVGRFREGADEAEAALNLARAAGDARLAAQIEATLGQILAGCCRYAQALHLMDGALDAKQRGSRPGGGLATGSAYTLGCKGYVHADQGDFAAGQLAFAEALSLLGDSTHPVSNSMRNWLAIAQIWQGRWDEAARVAASSVQIATGTGALLLLAASRAVWGYARWCAGDPQGLPQFVEAAGWMRARHCDFYASLFHAWEAEAAVVAGRPDELRRAARVVLRRCLAGERLGEAAACRALALQAARSGEPGRAQRWLRRADHSAASRQSPREAALNALVRAGIAEGRVPLVSGAAAGDASPRVASPARLAAWQALQSMAVRDLPPLYAGLVPERPGSHPSAAI
ncbi:ATP-binding protein [Piscinibacter sakaiensis]|uniref:ATP-binding protein n=1 Tax=Piscinibacter sakaiensis TaxID=1547922 RepID=UPI0006B68CB4|nr:AAA family ATPase [Piscinibacter sakaiensis]